MDCVRLCQKGVGSGVGRGERRRALIKEGQVDDFFWWKGEGVSRGLLKTQTHFPLRARARGRTQTHTHTHIHVDKTHRLFPAQRTHTPESFASPPNSHTPDDHDDESVATVTRPSTASARSSPQRATAGTKHKINNSAGGGSKQANARRVPCPSSSASGGRARARARRHRPISFLFALFLRRRRRTL